MLSKEVLSFSGKVINRTAWRMVGCRGITRDDLPDIKQDIWLDLLQRIPKYSPDRGHILAFITRVVNNKVASILKARTAAKRGGGIPILSLDWEHENEDGDSTELHETISVDDYLRRTRGTIRSEEERRDLAHDVRVVVARMSPPERVICLLLIDSDVSSVSGVIGIPRSTLRDLIKQLRANGVKVGLDKYFK